MGYDEPNSKRQTQAYTKPVAVKQRNRWPRRILLAALALGIGGYLAANPDTLQKITALGGSAPQAGGRAGRGAGAAPPVRVAIAGTRDVAVVVSTIGTVLANSIVNVKTQVDGPLLSIAFKEGQMVKKNDLLFRIDPAPFEAALRQSQATVARDQAQLSSAQADADRAVMLADRGIVSAQQRDQLVANSKALAATVAADQAAVDRAQLNLGYTTIRSPVDGKTGPYIVNAGNQVHAADAAGLVTITQIQPVKISFNLPQGNLPQLQDRMGEGQLIAAVTVRSDVAVASSSATDRPGADKNIPIKVDFIGNTVDARTGTIELRATFDNPDLRLVPGELVDINIQLQTLNQAVTVPREAVNVGQDGNYVFVVNDAMKAEMRPVKVLYQDQGIAAVGSGVKMGERVVTDGQLRVTPGGEVLITQPPGAPSAQAASQQPSAQAESQQPSAQATSQLSAAPDTGAQGTISKSASPQGASPQAAGPQGSAGPRAGRSGG